MPAFSLEMVSCSEYIAGDLPVKCGHIIEKQKH